MQCVHWPPGNLQCMYVSHVLRLGGLSMHRHITRLHRPQGMGIQADTMQRQWCHPVMECGMVRYSFEHKPHFVDVVEKKGRHVCFDTLAACD